ncbi:hypothetical protein H5410_023783, partial [Solanum commersonii]
MLRISDFAKVLVKSNLHQTWLLVYLLINLTLILRVATISVERAFSSMKYIKNEFRNSIVSTHEPKILDPPLAITNAVAKLTMNTPSAHHFCIWHIEKKIPEYLSHVFHEFDDFTSEFSKCLHCTTTPEEFETAWIDIMKMIYAIREKWIPAYVQTTFYAGMSTTQRSESMNKYFKDYLNSSTPMSVFVTQYDKVIDARYDKVREKDYKTKHSKAILKTLYPMEDEAAKIYTRKIFHKFQEELIQSQKFISEKIEVQDGIHIYKVHLFQRQTPAYIVRLNLELKNATCSCHKFEFMGILCRHMLMIFLKKQIHSLPPCYLLDRWTRYATTEKVNDISSAGSLVNNLKFSTIWFNNIMMHSLGISEQATRSEKHYKFTYQRLLQLCEQLDELPYEDVNDNVCDGQVNKSNMNLNSSEQRENFSLLDPPCVVTKGNVLIFAEIKKGNENHKKGQGSKNFEAYSLTKSHVSIICLICSSHTNVEEEFNSVEIFLNADSTMEFSAYSEPFQGKSGRADSYPTSFMDLKRATSYPYQREYCNILQFEISKKKLRIGNSDFWKELKSENLFKLK